MSPKSAAKETNKETVVVKAAKQPKVKGAAKEATKEVAAPVAPVVVAPVPVPVPAAVAGAPKKVKKAAKEASADKVKKAPSPYIVFCSAKRAAVKISHPNATFAETGKILGEMWAAEKKSK